MNFMFFGLKNIEIPATKYDIIPTGIISGLEMYLMSPECTLTYNGQKITKLVDNSSMQEDMGKYDWLAMMRKPIIAVWMETDEAEMHFQTKEAADKFYLGKVMLFSDFVLAFTLATWFVKDCSVYSDSYYWCNTDNQYSTKGSRNFQQTNAQGKMSVCAFNQEEIEETLGHLVQILSIFQGVIDEQQIDQYEYLYSQGTLVCNTEAAVKNVGKSFYRILILLQLARKTGFLPEKISMYCAVLECLFAIEKNHKKNISEMTAKFLTSDSQEADVIINDMRQAYSVRSDFVHGDVNILFDRNEELTVLSGKVDDYVRRAICKAFSDENCNYDNTSADKARVRKYFESLFLVND